MKPIDILVSGKQICICNIITVISTFFIILSTDGMPGATYHSIDSLNFGWKNVLFSAATKSKHFYLTLRTWQVPKFLSGEDARVKPCKLSANSFVLIKQKNFLYQDTWFEDEWRKHTLKPLRDIWLCNTPSRKTYEPWQTGRRTKQSCICHLMVIQSIFGERNGFTPNIILSAEISTEVKLSLLLRLCQARFLSISDKEALCSTYGRWALYPKPGARRKK